MNHKGQRKNATSGMTLMEVMVAFGLLSLLFMGLLGSFLMSKRAQLQGTSTMGGIHYARSVIEDLRRLSFYSSSLSVGTHSISNGYYVVTDSSGFAKTKDIYITVAWNDPGTHRTSTVEIATSISEAMRDD